MIRRRERGMHNSMTRCENGGGNYFSRPASLKCRPHNLVPSIHLQSSSLEVWILVWLLRYVLAIIYFHRRSFSHLKSSIWSKPMSHSCQRHEMLWIGFKRLRSLSGFNSGDSGHLVLLRLEELDNKEGAWGGDTTEAEWLELKGETDAFAVEVLSMLELQLLPGVSMLMSSDSIFLFAGLFIISSKEPTFFCGSLNSPAQFSMS